jgi:predicted phosphodiesterase
LDNPRYKLIFGNHDRIAENVLGAPESHVIEADNQRIVFFHGHQLEFLTRKSAKISEFFVCMGGWLERMGLQVTRFVDRVRPRVIVAAPRVGNFERAAIEFGKQFSADIVVTGHTHEAKRVEVGSQLFLNSGTCVSGRRELLLLDTKSKVFRVVREPDFM